MNNRINWVILMGCLIFIMCVINQDYLHIDDLDPFLNYSFWFVLGIYCGMRLSLRNNK